MEDHNEAEVDGVIPLSTTVQVVGSSKKISVIKRWTKEGKLKVINDVKFNGYSMKEATKNYEIAPTSLHY